MFKIILKVYFSLCFYFVTNDSCGKMFAAKLGYIENSWVKGGVKENMMHHLYSEKYPFI